MIYNVNISEEKELTVILGETAQMDVQKAVNYIESGKKEIADYVENTAKPEIEDYVENTSEPLVKTIINQQAQPIIDGYVNNTIFPRIDDHAQIVNANLDDYVDNTVEPSLQHYVDDAKSAQTAAATSATNAKASETAAAASAKAAADKATAAATSAKNAATSANNAQTYASNAQTAANAAAASAAAVNDVNLVHKTGNETIGGTKTFTSETKFQSNAIDISATPSSTEYGNNLTFSDVNGTQTAYIDTRHGTANEIATRLGVRRKISDIEHYADISVGVYANGTPYTYAPAPSVTISTTDSQIATTGWVNSTGNNVVHRSGSETIGGTKIFTSGTRFQSNAIDMSATPSSTEYGNNLTFYDVNGTQTSFIDTSHETSNTVSTRLGATRKISGTPYYAEIRVGIDADGNSFAYAPTPATFDNSIRIATTSYVNSKLQVVSALPASPDANVFYFIPE